MDLGQLWPLLRRCTKPNAAMCFTAQQPFASELLMSNRAEFRYELVWNKKRPTGFLNASKMPLKVHENIMVFYRRLPAYNPQMGAGRPYTVLAKEHERSTNYGGFTRRRSVRANTSRHPTSIIEIPAENNNRHKGRRATHPTPKPPALIEYLLRTYTQEGDLVLDPTAGALPTAVASVRTARRCVCIEQVEQYVEMGMERLASDHREIEVEQHDAQRQLAFDGGAA